MSSQPGSGEHSKPLGVRRPVEMPEADIEAADDLVPAPAAADGDAVDEEAAAPAASGQDPEDAQPAPSTEPTAESSTESSTDPLAESVAESSTESSTEPLAESVAESSNESTAESAADEKTESAAATKKGKRVAWLRNVAVATSSKPTAAAGDEMPPDRPRKPVLAAVAIGGVVLLAIPILLIGTGSHDGKKRRTIAAADRVMTGNAQPAPGPYVSASPTTTLSPSASPSPSSKKGKAKPGKSGAKSGAKDGTAGGGGGGGGVGVKSTGGRGPAGPRFSTVTHLLIKNTMTGLCADIPNFGNGQIEGPINQFTCTRSDGDNQLWDLVVNDKGGGPGGADLFTIRNSKDNYCFDLPGTGTVDRGTHVSENLCYPGQGDNQMWYLDKRYSRHFWIRNHRIHNWCLDVLGENGAGGKDAALTVVQCDPNDDHVWSFG